MSRENKHKLQKDINHLTSKLDQLVSNNRNNLKNENTLLLSQKLDILIVNYMKNSWQIA